MCPYCENEPEPGWIETENNGPIVRCPFCTPDEDYRYGGWNWCLACLLATALNTWILCAAVGLAAICLLVWLV